MNRKLRYHKKKTKGATLAMPEGLPGLRGKANWHVTQTLPGETPSTINYRGGEARMGLPSPDESLGQLTIIHEMLHAAHSPVEPPCEIPRADGSMIGVKAVSVAEEIRINLMMRFNMGSIWTDEHMDKNDLEEVARFMLQRPSPDTVEFLLIQHLCAWPLVDRHIFDYVSPVTTVLWNNAQITALSEEEQEYYYNIYKWLIRVTQKLVEIGYSDGILQKYNLGSIPGWKETVIPTADYLDQIFDSIPKVHHTAAAAAQKTNNSTSENPDLDKITQYFERPFQGNQMNDLAEDPTGIRTPVDFRKTNGVPKWGKLKIEEPPRPEKLPGKHLKKSRYRSTDMGVVPRNIHRSLIDGQVFATKRRVFGGSVLIDDSGSMSWLPEEIEAIMIAAPAVTIGAYSGARATGILKVLARNMRRVTKGDIKTPYGGNDVDLPALEWLAEQAEPRIWVTDGRVHPGQGGDPLAAAEECVDFCIKHNINVVEDAKQAHEVFTGQRALYR